MWQANIDTQYIIDIYAVIMYITAADPSGCFKNLNKLGNAFVRGNEIGIQECVCLLLRQRFVYTTRSVVFINTSLIEQRSYRLKSMEAIEKMEDGNTKYL